MAVTEMVSDPKQGQAVDNGRRRYRPVKGHLEGVLALSESSKPNIRASCKGGYNESGYSSAGFRRGWSCMPAQHGEHERHLLSAMYDFRHTCWKCGAAEL